nr:hypothetical protein [Vibrio cholerae]
MLEHECLRCYALSWFRRCSLLNRALGIWRYHESYLFDSLRRFIEWLLGHARISKTSVGF